ncbi:MAG: hypothetical protein K6G26_12755 [Lachnospiraceae bacterium]|nr:hypothetical protein [Lachnospiraceae bacterium]
MKKKIYFMIILIMAALLSGCKKNMDFPQNFNLGIIETAGETKDTSITLYNDDMEECGNIDIKKGNVCSLSSYAKIAGNNVFMLPAGRTGKSDEDGIISMDRKTGVVTEYNMGENRLFDFVVDKDNIYGISAKDINKSTLIIYGISDGNITYKEFDDITINRIFNDEDRIILCGFSYKSEYLLSKMIFINKFDYNIEKEMDITAFGISVNDVLRKENGYYIAFSTKKGEDGMSEEMADSVAYMENERIISIRTNEVISQIFNYNNEIYLICYNKLNDEGNAIIKLGENMKQRKIFVSDKIRQSDIRDNNMYVLGEKKLIVLDLDNNFKKQREIQIEHRLDNEDSYVSGFFVN